MGKTLVLERVFSAFGNRVRMAEASLVHASIVHAVGQSVEVLMVEDLTRGFADGGRPDKSAE